MVFPPVTCNVLRSLPTPARTLHPEKVSSHRRNPSRRKTPSLYHRWRITLSATCTCSSSHRRCRVPRTSEWWMNVNVIKQFSVYLKLQTFTPQPNPPSRWGRRNKHTKNYFSPLLMPFASRQRWDNAKKIVFLSPPRSSRDPVASLYGDFSSVHVYAVPVAAFCL